MLIAAIIETGDKNMSQSIRTSVDRIVSDITPKQRDAIEDLIGGGLASDQRIFVLAYRPGVEPTEAEKAAARKRIEELLCKAQGNSSEQGVTSSEIDAAIAEAIRSTDD